VHAWLNQNTAPGVWLDPTTASLHAVTNIDYDAKGQRQRIEYGKVASTFYDYDKLTFRLMNLVTRRNAVNFPGDCPQTPPAGWAGCQVQNLHYTYDPAGNLTTDAHLAALAISHGAVLVSFDTDFGRFKGLRWSRPESP
jgi:hypothetical protein